MAMPPKSRGQPSKKSTSNKEDASSASTAMAGKRVTAEKGKGRALSSRHGIPDVYREMLAEALPSQTEIPERPLKRRKTLHRDQPRKSDATQPVKSDETDVDKEEEDEDVEFEDVLGGNESNDSGDESDSTPKAVQTAYRDSDDDSGGSDLEWEALDFEAHAQGGEPSGDLELTLTTRPTPQRQKATPRRKAVTKAERVLRLEIHKMHVLCLLSHVDRRNDWCNSSEIKSSLKPLLDKKMVQFLKPKSSLSQFGRAESLKRGIDQVSMMWRKKFTITNRGLRRGLWADDEKDIQNYKLPDDAEPAFQKSDFRTAAKTLKGSRDLGAQLYCALLRSGGVDARLVCSLQPLSFNAGGPAMPRVSAATKASTPDVSDESEAVDIGTSNSPFAAESSLPGLPVAPRRRLGHPNVADYHMPTLNSPAPAPPKPKRKVLHESPYPVFWVEVFDEAHQKWFPVDPLVTESIAKPRVFEPPAADRENSMAYVITFEDVGCARDVTRRYTKAYNAKIRKNRVESTHGGVKWWRKTMRAYAREWISDADQIEDTELAAIEAREPMPKNIADFKDHPYYALERHLRRNEVLVGNREIGKVAAGRDSSTPGGKKMESIFRRRDVRVARSADAWYRLGKEIKMGEQPIKTVEPKGKGKEEEHGEGGEECAGTGLYSEDQTELYEAPPIVNGRVPKNSFGNLDVFVPSMVPKGGVHLPYDEASRAARILGIDYSDALTGFEFRGRHGTAVLKGIVVATEYRDAVEAVIEGFRDDHARLEERIRMVAALNMWRHLLMSLRIKQRVDAYEIDGEEPYFVPDVDDDDMGMQSEEYSDDGGGGFFPE